ncbi:MAG TPA: hypothetical protein VND99_02455 [Candidatus Acidoferrales bacterium]|nr:hypothetical protein [Candidatus Acidoferrales bacterium]
MSKNKQQQWLVFIILIYVVVAAAGFLIAYLIKVEIFQPRQASSSPTPIISNQSLIHKPANWKTYTNTDYKLKFSYPPTDSLKESSYGFGVTSIALHKTNGDLDFQILLMPKTLAAAAGQDFDSYYALPDNTTKVIKSPLSNDNTTEKFTKIHDISVNGLQAIDYQSVASNVKPNEQPEIGTFIQAGDNLILISTGKSNKTKLQKMLSTVAYPL